MGVKKSTLCTKSLSSLKETTAASSDSLNPTITLSWYFELILLST